MAGPTYYPSPTGLDPLDAPLSVNTTLTFGVGAPTDLPAKLVLELADITYDQVETVSVDVGVTAPANDISLPDYTKLALLYKPTFNPDNAYLIGALFTCEYGEAALYFATDLTSSSFFNPPDVASFIPVPLIPGGWFLYVNNHPYETADWQSATAAPVYVGEILAATFKPSRITGYLFFKDIEV
jgi:hypothetical protein